MISTLAIRDRRRKAYNFMAISSLYAIALVAILPLFFIFAYLVYKGLPNLSLAFFTETPKPSGDPGGGMSNAIIGSALLLFIACLIGIPTGMFAGIYLAEYRDGNTVRILRFVTDLLTTVPSIVVGIFAYGVLVLPMKTYSAYAGGFALAIIMIPIVARTTEEMLKLMPDHIREAGLALGLARWKVIMHLVLPGSLSGVVTGIMLAVARVMGETAPLLFTAFSNIYGFRGLNRPVASLPVQIFNYASSQDDVWRAKAWTGALVLVVFVFLINLVTRFLMPVTRSK